MLKATIRGARPLRWAACGILLCCLPACAPTRQVYIPPEWLAAPPPPPPPPQVRPQTAERPSAPKEAPTNILQSSPSFKESTITESAEPPAAKGEKPPEAQPQPQYLASMHLVDQARTQLKGGNTEQAISLLEQAIQVDGYNGEAFFLLARAWRTKGSRNKALEFARKAEILLQEQRPKLKEVYLFEAEVCKEGGEASKADGFRKKAARL